MYKHGVMVARCQPFHIGHERIIDRMLEECEVVTIVLGSINMKDGKNPWAFHDRKKMIKNVYRNKAEWSKMRILGAPDINNDSRWAHFILEDIVKEYYIDELEHKDYHEADAYYAGSQFDGRWFEEQKLEIVYVDRTFQDFPFVSATMIRDMMVIQDPRWKLYVNKENYKLLETHYRWLKWDRL